jgi:hypothetical protein
MKRLILTFTILAIHSLIANCQSTTTDSILCKPVRIYKNLLIAAKQKDYADSLVSLYRNDITILSKKVDALEIKDSTNKEINSTYQAMIGTMKEQRTVLEVQITYLNRELKRQKTKTTLTAIGGIALSAIITGLFIFK